jgi:hypothetical protein
MITQNRIDRNIAECFINLVITVIQTLYVSFNRRFPNTVIYYITSEVNIRDILQINIICARVFSSKERDV